VRRVSDPGGALATPHPNGGGGHRARNRPRPPKELIALLGIFVVIATLVVVGWIFFGSRSPERLDEPAAAEVTSACRAAQEMMNELPNPAPRGGDEIVARMRAENGVLRAMTARLSDVRPVDAEPAEALRAWVDDWARVTDARARFVDTLETEKRAQFVLPASRGVKPVTGTMDDFVRVNHPTIDACFTEALQLEVVDQPREYGKVTQ
jgi:hypothetical protein